MSLINEMSILTKSIVGQIIRLNIRLPAFSSEEDQQYQTLLDHLERDIDTYLDMLDKKEDGVVLPPDPIDLKALLDELKLSVRPANSTASPVKLFLERLQDIVTYMAAKVKPNEV